MLHKTNDQESGVVVSGLVVVLLTCLLLLSGCAATPPDQKLLSGTPTTSTGNPGYQGRGTVDPIEVTNASLTTYPGGFMSLTIRTSPFAVCNFVVYYGLKKASQELGIVPVTANTSGNASWHWRVESGAHTGLWPLTVTATLPSGAQAKSNINVVVTGAPISVLSSSLSAKPGGPMTLSIATAPKLACSITFALGPGGDARTLNAQANDKGIADWKWNIGTKAVPGVWPMTITAILADGEQTTITVDVTVLPAKHH